MPFLIKENIGIISGFLFGLILFVEAGLSAAVLVFSLVLTYLIVGGYLSDKVFDSKLYRLILSGVIYTIILQTVILSAWVFNHNFPLDQSIAVTGLFIIVSYLFERFFGNNRLALSPKAGLPALNYADFCSISVALIIVSLVLFMPIKNYFSQYKKVDIPSINQNYINTSLDDSSHLSRINDRLQLNRGVLYESDAVQSVIHQNTISTYPPGWHSANAAMIKALYPEVTVGGQSTVAYVITKIIWLFVLVYCFCRVVFSLFSLFIKRSLKDSSYAAERVWLTGSLLFFSYYVLLEQFKEGFYNFIPLLTNHLLVLALLLQLGFDKNSGGKDSPDRFRTLFPLTLVLTGAVLSWFLVLPAAVVALVVIVCYPFKSSRPWEVLLKIGGRLKGQVLLLVMAVLAVAVQARVITADASRSFREGVNDPGAITMHSNWYFVFIVAGVILFYGLVAKKLRVIAEVTPLLVSLLGISLFIYLFQLITIHKPEYYYYKTLNTVLIVALPIAITGWLILFRLVTSRYDRLSAVFISCGLVICLPLAIGVEPLNTSNLSYIGGVRAFTPTENSFIYDNMSARGRVPLASRTNDTIFYTPNQTGHNIIGTNIVRSIQKVDDCDAKIFTALLTNNEDGLFSTISSCQSSHLTIATNPESYDRVSEIISNRSLNNKVTVLVIR